MDLSVKEAALLLAVAEDTVYRWIRDGALPAHRVQHQYRLNRVELQEWAAVHGHRVSPRLFEADAADAAAPSLADALARGGIHRDVPGATRGAVLEAVTRLPGIPEHVDRAMLYQLLLARESLAATGVGRGIALPHPRDPLVLRLGEPRVLLCFPAKPVDFGAPDREPIRALFLLLTPSVKLHLQILARLAYALHDPVLNQLLAPTQDPAAIVDRVRALERARPP